MTFVDEVNHKILKFLIKIKLQFIFRHWPCDFLFLPILPPFFHSFHKLHDHDSVKRTCCLCSEKRCVCIQSVSNRCEMLLTRYTLRLIIWLTCFCLPITVFGHEASQLNMQSRHLFRSCYI